MGRISVLAGVNGAGKSSIAGAAIRAHGSNYFNPDEVARQLLTRTPGLALAEANSMAWREGKRLLELAIARNLDFAFETTLGGNTITGLLLEAANHGCEVWIWFAGLYSVDRHLERVRARVRKGGHDIPEAAIRKRWESSRANLITLMPKLAVLRVFDNSADGDPAAGKTPSPVLALAMKAGRIVGPSDLSKTPGWAKPLVAAAFKLQK